MTVRSVQREQLVAPLVLARQLVLRAAALAQRPVGLVQAWEPVVVVQRRLVLARVQEQLVHWSLQRLRFR